MERDERSGILQLLNTLSADDKIRLISFLRSLRGNECSSKPLASSREAG